MLTSVMEQIPLPITSIAITSGMEDMPLPNSTRLSHSGINVVIAIISEESWCCDHYDQFIGNVRT